MSEMSDWGAVMRHMGEQMREPLRSMCAEAGHLLRKSIAEMNAGIRAQARARREAIDDELDWLGDYRGRRG